jgi:hypothetical protein
MSTNFYAHFELGGSSGVFYKMHIGKATRSSPDVYGLSTVSGRHFPDIESWVKFLRHNTDSVVIRDEYGTEVDTEEFIAEYLEDGAASSEKKIQWLRDHEHDPNHSFGGDSLKIWDEPQADAWRSRHWIDPQSGKLFLSGEFS